ncbi:MAG: hypothetical protein ACJAR9_000599 [Celeribacter sp.]|jgi:hypothetical protein
MEWDRDRSSAIKIDNLRGVAEFCVLDQNTYAFVCGHKSINEMRNR